MEQVLDVFMDEVAYDIEVDFECGFFDVAKDNPEQGVNLVVFHRPTYEQKDAFVAAILREMEYWRVRSVNVFSVTPLFILDRRGKLEYQGAVLEQDEFGPWFGPFNKYTFSV